MLRFRPGKTDADGRPVIIYTDEVRTLGPLAWILAACFVCWAVLLYAWPAIIGSILAIGVVITISAVIGGRPGKA